ncbi:11050_t:CDS:2 [Scutellospora calospora]|uniref:11050_t:CDS:1 n=1 Tax=Scutellospora calospora TaxID=85575 RepID=A0ACA9L063_9GLOM|nr:11050_t:CDS:2 [Scutellospora calospora]
MKTLLYYLVFNVLLLAVLPTGFAQTIHYSNFTYDEISYQDNLTGTPPHVLAIRHYQSNDNVAVIRVGRVNNNIGTNTCFEQRLLLRVLQGNGNVIEINYTNTSEIQDINFCYVGSKDPLNFYPLFDQYILVTYTHATNTSDNTTFMDRGMVLNWNGTVASFIDFGPSYLEPVTNNWHPNEYFANNINPQRGFFRLSVVNGTNNFKWQQYAYFQLTVIQFLNGGYAIIYANTSNNIIPSNNANSTLAAKITPTRGIYALIFSYNQTITPNRIILYELPQQNLTFNSLYCSVDFASIGHSCIASVVGTQTIQNSTNITTIFTTTTTPPVGTPTVVPGQPTTTYTNEVFFVNIRFLSSGSLISLDLTIPLSTSVININLVNLRTLPYGGYVILWRSTSVLAVNYNFSIYDENNQLSSYYFPINPIIANLVSAFDILQNNTMLMAQNESLSAWNILSITMPKLSPYNDNGYGNLRVSATYPPNQLLNQISLNNKVINITFENPVTFGSGSLNIFSIDGTLRQTLNMKNCDSSQCNATGNIISLNVFDFTFNNPDGQYFIQMDNSFVLDAKYNEPLLGIEPRKWIFQTGGIQGALRLTDEGTIHYQNLSFSDQSNFINTLQNELTLMIPTEQGRLYSINNNVQYDPNQKSRIFISLSIKGVKFHQKLFSTDVMKYLNLLITNKATTGISTGTTTKYLDASYGYQKNLAKMRTKLEDKDLVENVVILQFGVTISRFTTYILFVIFDSSTIPFLFLPRPEFVQWFALHARAAATVALISGANIDMLLLLKSYVMKLDLFRAPLSDKSLKIIYIGSCINIVLLDIPQFIIQIIFLSYSVIWDPILIFSSLASGVSLLANIIGKILFWIFGALSPYIDHWQKKMPVNDVIDNKSNNVLNGDKIE